MKLLITLYLALFLSLVAGVVIGHALVRYDNRQAAKMKVKPDYGQALRVKPEQSATGEPIRIIHLQIKGA